MSLRPGWRIKITSVLLLVELSSWTEGSEKPTRAIAQAVPVAAAARTSYWAGYVATRDAPYSGVSATWRIPRVACPSPATFNATAYVWIGEGGYVRGLASSLIQAGTASDCFGGVARYHAFYEWYPGSDARDFPLSVHPGDSVSVTISQRSPGYWELIVRDDSTGLRSTTLTQFVPDTESAEFVVERPTVCNAWTCMQVELPRFGAITFDRAMARGATAVRLVDPRTSVPVALVDPATNVALAVPGRLRAVRGAVSVLWQHSQ